ncbi:MAG: hypothetical protein J6X18_03685 [Bacteroidales bacterium]|nr:hypothetical protein [Bacteroidales bacterium]
MELPFEIPLENAVTAISARVGTVLHPSLFLGKQRSNPETNKNFVAVGFTHLLCMVQLNQFFQNL